MRKVFYSLVLSVICLLGVKAGFAQKGQISGSLTDSSGKSPVAYATITVFTAQDTSIVTYRMSDETGKFKVPGLPVNKALRAVITATGFDVWRHEFTLTAENNQLEIPAIKMLPNVQELEEVLVVSERPPVVVRKDTIEFNAAAFKTLPTALVEDLLKKFPGVDVDKEGNITVNGRKVNKMLVEGKEFFGTDPKIASKNLPANLIDKVQVVDDKEELQRNPDLSAGEVGQVINLKLKKSIKQGWFGKLYAGAGTDERYEAGGIVNMFRDTLQVSALGYTNNLNRSGFGYQDVMNIGGFNRNNINSMMVSSTGGFALNDISFGGLGQGLQRTSGGGINANTLLGKKTTLSLQYFYGQNNGVVQQKTLRQQFFSDTTLYSDRVNDAETNDYSHRISAYLKTKLDSTSTLEYRPSFSFVKKDANSTDSSMTTSNFDPLINKSINEQRQRSKGFSMQQELSYSKQFKKKGRSFYATLNFNLNNNKADQYNDVENQFYKTNSSTLLQQLRNQDQHSWNGRLYVNYNEPLTKSLSLRLTQTLELFHDKDNIASFEYDHATGEYIIPDEAFTNGLERDGLRNSTFAGVSYKYKKWTITPGATWRYLQIDNEFKKDPSLKQSFSFIMPAISVRWDKWNFNYNVFVNEPQITDLQPTVNNTNPLFISMGNPALKPTKSHSLSVNAYSYDAKNSINYNLYLNGNISEDAVIRQRTINENGVQVSSPVNTDGVWRGQMSASMRKQYKYGSKWKISAGPSIYATYNQSLVLLNQNRSTTRNFMFNPGVNASINWDDKIELNPRYGPAWSKASYEDNIYPGLELWRHTAATDLIVRMPKKIVWETSLDYNYNPQVAAGLQKNIYRWNAAVNFLFLKQDKGQLKLSVFDILNQNNTVYRNIAENFITDTEILSLRRYFLLTFTYNIRNFAGKVGGRDRFLMF
ncbi:outer membrane beta-barrel protein [Terrimonas rubra]|uniref:Outer membrane beta-barrel protein n=1 Tax=Terrimonas rubra TaxID=1035890 RepID=A0ABW6A676_9BACT